MDDKQRGILDKMRKVILEYRTDQDSYVRVARDFEGLLSIIETNDLYWRNNMILWAMRFEVAYALMLDNNQTKLTPDSKRILDEAATELESLIGKFEEQG